MLPVERVYAPCSLLRAPLSLGAAVFVGWLGATAVSAQQASVPPPADPQPVAAQTTVTVTARPAGYRSSIDAKSYSLADDLKTATGTLADVLRDVPAVSVDIEGAVSLRGDSNVTILVDGKPSALFSGPGRAQALQSISADQFARIEVQTNPSAGQTAEGSGGVINLISKKPAKGGGPPTASGTLRAQVGVGDRFDLNASGAYAAGPLSLNASADVRRGAFSRGIETRYGIPDPTTGALDPALATQVQGYRDNDVTLNGSLGYDLDPVDHVDASLSNETYRAIQSEHDRYVTGPTSGPLALDYLSPAFLHDFYTTTSESLGLTRTLPGEDHRVSVMLTVSQSRLVDRNVADFAYTTPVQPDFYQDKAQTRSFPELDFKVDYRTHLPNKAKLTLGYEGRFDWQTETTAGVDGVSAALASADPAFSQRFTFDQQVHALYATYEQAFGTLTVQPGLRLETTTVQTDLVSAGQVGRQAYLKAFPSLHLDYTLDDNAEIKASYGRRIKRPEDVLLDPFRIENSPTSFSVGNPNLKPVIIQSWELGYEYRKKTTDLQATLFYRDKSDVFTSVTQDIGGNVLLATTANLGHVRDTGLELVFNRELLSHLSVNASIDLRHSEVDAGNIGIGGVRTDFIISARATVNWQLGAKDFFQIGAQGSGRELTAQGYYGGSIFSDLGWRHRFGDRWSTVVTGQDPFGLSRRTIAIDTPTLAYVQKRKFNFSAVFFTLSYVLGGGSKKPADNFDFGAQRPGGM